MPGRRAAAVAQVLLRAPARYIGRAGRADRRSDQAIKLNTSFSFEQLSPVAVAKDVKVPTLLYQVRDDSMTKPVDVQTIFDAVGTMDKDLFWIEGTTRRWDGYNYFSRDPKRMLNWFDRYMS